MKYNIDTTYEVTDYPQYKYRALSIINPQWNFTGEYSCSLQSFSSFDRKYGFLQVIVVETDFNLMYNVSTDGNVYINCTVRNIYPVPNLDIM